MKIKILAAVLALLVLLPCLAGCDEAGSAQLENMSQMQLYEALFDPADRVEIRVDITQKELKKLQQDYDKYASFGSKSPIYRMADVHITIITPDQKHTFTIPQVGVRMKGNTSRTSFYNDWDGIYSLIHLKLDFQETFDDPAYYGSDALTWTEKDRKERKNRTFATLEKLEVRWNKNDDGTYIREGYAYEIYRSFGVMAPMSSLASLDFGGEHFGVCAINEPVDEVFLEKRLPKSQLGGDLYKCGWAKSGARFTDLGSIGIEDEDKGQFYSYDLKSNRSTSTHERLKHLINALNSSVLSKDRMEAMVDMPYFVNYAAASYILGNPDDLRNNYNNFYLYFLADTGKAVIIPYDYDRCLGVNKDWDPTGHGMTREDPFASITAADGKPQKNPLFIHTVCAGGWYIQEYKEALQRGLENPLLTEGEFNARYFQAQSLYADDTAPSRVFRNAENCNFRFDINDTSHGNLTFGDYIARKLATLRNALG